MCILIKCLLHPTMFCLLIFKAIFYHELYKDSIRVVFISSKPEDVCQHCLVRLYFHIFKTFLLQQLKLSFLELAFVKKEYILGENETEVFCHILIRSANITSFERVALEFCHEKMIHGWILHWFSLPFCRRILLLYLPL